ncbi:MAG TPA: hypothetical protein VKV28_10075 [Candidatus Binataceae bacterium]|nr:hypothetical protein [Candidatus Binataceae bacterium]
MMAAIGTLTTAWAASRAVDEIEPANARVEVLKAEPVYEHPNLQSRHLRRMTPGNFIRITGATPGFLRVSLKNGDTGYIEPDSVRLVKPMKRVFRVTLDTPVFAAPNRWARHVGAVRASRYVNVTGMALGYMRVRLKDGTVGFIPKVSVQ